MKYLKKFNESIHENNFEEFVKDGLVQLLDTGFYINLKNFENSYGIYISKDGRFNWRDINDDINQFLEILYGRDILESVYIKTVSGFSVNKKYDDIFSELNNDYYTNIEKIVISVKK
mgnify:CR=1 FL=1|jgi:hypothetical protein